MICCKKLRQATQKHKEKNFKKNNKKLLKTINKGIKEKARKGLYSYTARTDRPFSLEERELLKNIIEVLDIKVIGIVKMNLRYIGGEK